MMTLGLIVLWCGLFFLLYGKIISILKKFRSVESARHEQLQFQLHKNFVFRENKKIRKHSYFFFVVGTVVSLLFRSWILFFLVLGIFSIFPWVWIKIVEFLRQKQFQKQLLLFIPSLSSMLKSGHGLERALHELKHTSKNPMSEELGYVLKEIQLGIPLEESLEQLSKRFSSENMMMLIQAIIISRKLGTSLSEAIDHIAVNVLEKEKLRQQILSLTSQGKMQAWVACAMPFFMFAAVQLISPNYFKPLLTTTMGHIGIAYCFLSMSCGLFWIYKITHKEYL